jgi:general secretion pathway protein C
LQADSFFKLLTDNRLVFIVTLLLVAVLAWQIAVLGWQLVPLPAISETAIPPSSDNSAVRNQSLSIRQKINRIASAELFGSALKEAVNVTPVEVEDAPESTLNYKLRGIYYSEDKELASAILQINNKDTKYFRLGDEIDKQIYIKQINPDHILISRQGRLEKLLLEKPLANLKAARGAAINRRGISTSPAASRVLQSYKRRYADNPMALAKRFQSIPVSENGRIIGYKLKALRGERLLNKLGLKKDDVFVAVNGIGLDKPFQALDALKSLTTADDVSLTVIRNGNRQTLDFSLKQ